MNNRASRFDNATPDSINSEFFHEIFFRNKETPLPGYSGKVGYREKRGSPYNFLNYVLRLMKNKYYPGSERNISGIIFYQTKGEDRVVRMYPEKAIWEPKYLLEKSWEKTINTIDRMYDLLREKWPLEKIQDHLMIKKRVSDYFDPHDLSERHKDPEALAVYCRQLVDNGYPLGELKHYYRRYTEKFFKND